jgi:4-hydroxy-4-methyl-2-oxoglutarate aldolase
MCPLQSQAKFGSIRQLQPAEIFAWEKTPHKKEIKMDQPSSGMLNSKQIEALRSFDSATIANAVKALDVRHPCEGFTNLDMRCFFPDYRPVVGYAVTFCEDTASASLPYETLYRTIEAAAKPAIIVIKNVGSDRLRSDHIGDIMAVIFQRLGGVALLTDGGVRDIDGVHSRAPGFQLFGEGTVPGSGIPRLVAVNIPVTLFGLTIKPGDLLHGDLNGIVSIPNRIAAQVAEQAQKIVEKESRIFEFLKGPDFSLDKMLENFSFLGE